MPLKNTHSCLKMLKVQLSVEFISVFSFYHYVVLMMSWHRKPPVSRWFSSQRASNAGVWWLFCYCPEQTFTQRVEFTVIWYPLKLTKYHSNITQEEYQLITWDMTTLTHCGPVTPYADIDLCQLGLGNGLMPDGTKPSPEPMWTYH